MRQLLSSKKGLISFDTLFFLSGVKFHQGKPCYTPKYTLFICDGFFFLQFDQFVVIFSIPYFMDP